MARMIETIAGTGEAGWSGDGGPARDARLNEPFMVEADAAGNLFVAEARNHTIRRIDAGSGVITTVVGSGVSGYSGDGGPATAAAEGRPYYNRGAKTVTGRPSLCLTRILPVCLRFGTQCESP